MRGDSKSNDVKVDSFRETELGTVQGNVAALGPFRHTDFRGSVVRFQGEESPGTKSNKSVKETEAQAPQKPKRVRDLKDHEWDEYLMVIIGGCLLCFNSGYINGVCVSTEVGGYSVMNLSGDMTSFALAVASGDRYDLETRALLIITFVCGSIMTGMAVPSSSFDLSLNYLPVILLELFFILMAAILENLYEKENYFFYMAAIAGGIQNALTTHYSGAVLRTTHWTGAWTDSGVCIGRNLRGSLKNDFFKVKVLIPLFVTFLLGVITAGLVYPYWGRNSLIFSAAYFSVLLIIYMCFILIKTKSRGGSLHAPYL